SFQRIMEGEDPFVAHGDLLENWQRTPHENRLAIVADPLPKVSPTQEEPEWAAFFVATIVQLCLTSGIPVPEWTKDPKYPLAEPWYMGVKSEKLRRHYRETTPMIFALYNVFGGDDILSRV